MRKWNDINIKIVEYSSALAAIGQQVREVQRLEFHNQCRVIVKAILTDWATSVDSTPLNRRNRFAVHHSKSLIGIAEVVLESLHLLIQATPLMYAGGQGHMQLQ